jgi:glycosyltransferase involved in cell wall biosynthesis
VLRFAIHSVLAQTFSDFELLIVGDGCTDHTAAVVRQFDDPRVKWFDLPKAPGFGYANRNHALRQARGELIAFMAHDDLWLPDHLQVHTAAFDDPAVEIAYTRPLIVSSDGIITPNIFNLHDPRTLEHFLKGRIGLPASCMVHRRRCFDKYGYWDDTRRRGADWELWTRILNGGGRSNFAYLPVPTILHFVADWRRQRFGNRARLALYRAEGSLPLDLIVPLPPGMTEQQAVWQAMNQDPSGWTRRLRRAIDLYLDRRADAQYPSTVLTFFYQQVKKLVR